MLAGGRKLKNLSRIHFPSSLITQESEIELNQLAMQHGLTKLSVCRESVVSQNLQGLNGR